MDSILISIKKLLGIDKDYKQFDADIIMAINTSLMILCQLGVGPKEGFSIEDASATWDEFVDETSNLNAVKSYVHLKTKLEFDPPQSGIVTETYNKLLSEYEWRLNVEVNK